MTAVCIPFPLEWPSLSLGNLCLVEPNYMNHLPDLAMVLLQLGEGATSGVAVFKTSLQVEEGSYHQLLRSSTPTWGHGRNAQQQECHHLDWLVEPAPHCWIHCTGLVEMMAALFTVPFTD